MATKKSEYDGYVGLNNTGGVVVGKTTKQQRARGAADAFKRDSESSRTTYDTYKRKTDPDSKTMYKMLGRADESAHSKLRRAHNEADSEMTRERRKGATKGK